MPFWTLTFFAARTAIRRKSRSGRRRRASGCRRFAHVIFPLLGNLYLVCTLLSTLWTIGDFTTVYLVPKARLRIPRTCWPRSASTMPLMPPNHRSASPRDVGPPDADPDCDHPDATLQTREVQCERRPHVRRAGALAALSAAAGSRRGRLGEPRGRAFDLVADARIQHVVDRRSIATKVI